MLWLLNNLSKDRWFKSLKNHKTSRIFLMIKPKLIWRATIKYFDLLINNFVWKQWKVTTFKTIVDFYSINRYIQLCNAFIGSSWHVSFSKHNTTTVDCAVTITILSLFSHFRIDLTTELQFNFILSLEVLGVLQGSYKMYLYRRSVQ